MKYQMQILRNFGHCKLCGKLYQKGCCEYNEARFPLKRVQFPPKGSHRFKIYNTSRKALGQFMGCVQSEFKVWYKSLTLYGKSCYPETRYNVPQYMCLPCWWPPFVFTGWHQSCCVDGRVSEFSHAVGFGGRGGSGGNSKQKMFLLTTAGVMLVQYWLLSSTLREIDHDTACVVCISVSLGFPYMVSVSPLFSLCGIHMTLFPCMVIHPIVLGMALLWAAMDSPLFQRTAIGTSQWYHRYCFTEYAQTWARHRTTHWQCECMAITDLQSIKSL